MRNTTSRRLLAALGLAAALATPLQAQDMDCFQTVPLADNITLLKGKPFCINEQTRIIAPKGNDDMLRNARFLRDYVEEATGYVLQTATEQRRADRKGHITLALNNKMSANPEAYRITTQEKGILIEGPTPAGVFYGIQTLRKVLHNNMSEANSMLQAPSSMLKSSMLNAEPRFSYRGMLLDCSRHFFPTEFVKEYIDILALHGMNRFHWHLTDDQGWRIEIKRYPRLTEVGAWRSGTIVGRNSPLDDSLRYGGFYTQEQVKEIVKYAADRYITVIPEIDMPGHMLGALAAYPELGCTGGPYEVFHEWGVFPDILCAGQEKTFEFVEGVLDEVMQLFPSEYIHIGGDEAPRDRWQKCPKCQQRIRDEHITAQQGKSAEAQLQGYFTNRIARYLAAHGKRLIGWDELLECNVDTTATIMSWRGAKPGAEAAKLNHDVIMTPNSHCYFDYYQVEKNWNEPMAIGGLVTVEKTYSFEPVADELSEAMRHHILGVQANLWTEYITSPRQAEYMVLPRMAALAEVQWMQPQNKNYDSFKQRVRKLKRLYDKKGWAVAPHIFF